MRRHLKYETKNLCPIITLVFKTDLSRNFKITLRSNKRNLADINCVFTKHCLVNTIT